MGGLGQRGGGCGKAETLCPYAKTPFKVLSRGGAWRSPAVGHKGSIPAQLLPWPGKSSFSLKSPLTFSRALGASHPKLPGYHASVSLETFWNDVLERAVRFG